MIESHLKSEPLATLPDDWRKHSLEESFRSLLGSQHPRARGGEDLPDLAPGEVEIARMTLVDSVHGEVTSLRAKQMDDGNIALSLVDEYETDYELSQAVVSRPQTDEEILRLFETAVPSPLETSCEVAFTSFFYPNLDDDARRLGIQPRE
jgi:hypothetical protein